MTLSRQYRDYATVYNEPRFISKGLESSKWELQMSVVDKSLHARCLDGTNVHCIESTAFEYIIAHVVTFDQFTRLLIDFDAQLSCFSSLEGSVKHYTPKFEVAKFNRMCERL
jgi:hypothetical protein